MTFWYGSGPDPRILASDSWIRIRILDPSIFVIDFQDAKFFCLFLFEGIYIFSKIKSQQQVAKQ